MSFMNHDDLKIICEKITLGRYRVPKFGQTKKTASISIDFLGEITPNGPETLKTKIFATVNYLKNAR